MTTLLNTIATIGGIGALFWAAVTLGHALAGAFRAPEAPKPASWLARMGGDTK